MKNLMKYVMLGLLPVLILVFAFDSEAVNFKRPLTLKSYGDQRYLEWTGTLGPTATNDSVFFLADTATANMYLLDPSSLLFVNKSASAGFNPWVTWPGNRINEKICGRLTGQSSGDASDLLGGVYFATTKNGAPALDAGTATISAFATTLDTRVAQFAFDPGKFFRFLYAITSATDTITYTRFTAWACDD